MRKPALLALIALLVVALAAGAGIFLSKPGERLRACGHPYPFSERFWRSMGIRGATHCCHAGTTIAELKQIGGAADLYRLEHGVYPTTLNQVTNYIVLMPLNYCFTGDGKRWSVSVPKQEGLPGYYLMTSEDAIHFHKDRPATTNDLDLQALRRSR